MAASSVSETKRVRYLLGLSSPAEREQIESDFFEDEDAFQEMLAAEDDLIDAYARSELTAEERRRFEKNFVSSSRGRDRIKFARAFAGTVSATRPVETKVPGTLLDNFKTFQSPGLFRIAMIAVVIVFTAILAWLVTDRQRMSNELRKLHAESVELSKQTEALRRNSDAERTRTSEITQQLAVLGTPPDKPRHREHGTTTTQRLRHLPWVKNGREEIASTKPEQIDQANITVAGVPVENLKNGSPIPRNTISGSIVRGTAKDPQGNVVSDATVTLTDPARNFTRTQHTNKEGAYVFNAVPPGTYLMKVQASGFKTALASGLAVLVDNPTVRDVQLEIGDVTETVDVTAAGEALINRLDATLGNSFVSKRITQLPLEARSPLSLMTLQPGVSRTDSANGGRSDQSNITLDGVDANPRIPSSHKWVRFQIALETAAIHEDYRLTIKTADGHRVISVDWIEPLTPNQTIIDTPAISTNDMPPGDYVLLLMGKGPDGLFVNVAEYSFRVIRY